jgi:hypothetical protein
MNPIEIKAERAALEVQKQKTWEMLQAILPSYLDMFTSTDEAGIPNTNFRMAVAWARETAEYAYNEVFKEQESKTEEIP